MRQSHIAVNGRGLRGDSVLVLRFGQKSFENTDGFLQEVSRPIEILRVNAPLGNPLVSQRELPLIVLTSNLAELFLDKSDRAGHGRQGRIELAIPPV